MPNLVEGQLNAQGLKVGLLVSRFNSFICERLVEGAIDALQRHGAESDDITVVRVPGAFEIPPAARQMAGCGRFDAIVCLGAVIRGSTPHFDYVSAEVSKGVAAVAMESSLPVTFGVLTTDTLEQAIERAGSKAGNKGFDAAMAAIEMANLYRALV
ncbi:MAG: 6,7-dimethyl-8-ribityllumazine synthase [Desulfuromonas sp.]|nr:MAG: 6,7-dimethyl-8-ribityllumazine synthase [Desulfuromonas sp.]